MTEGEVCDRYLVKSVFYSLYFGADRVRLETDDYKKFADCFVDYEERTQNIEQETGPSRWKNIPCSCHWG